MAAVPFKVAEAFLRREPAQSGAFVSVGDAIYSYALRLAHWEGEMLVIDVALGGRQQSVTTARHVRALSRVLEGEVL